MAYAMGNGTEEAKVAARPVAGTNANDGVAIAPVPDVEVKRGLSNSPNVARIAAMCHEPRNG